MLWKLTSISPRWWITNPRPGLLTPRVIVKLSILRGVNNQGKVCFDTELCSSWMRGGRKLRAHGGWLVVKIPYKTMCFCVFYENDRSETSQARHIQLAKTFLKPCFYSCLNARRAQTWAHGWQLCGPGLSKYRIKPCVFVYVMKMTTQKLHKHNTSNLQTNLLKPSFYWCIECAAGSKLRAHGGQLWCQLVKIHNKSLRFCVLCEITTQKLHKHNTCNLQKTLSNITFIYVLNARRAKIEGTWRAIGGADLSAYLIKHCVFCALYENDNAGTSQAQHIKLAKKHIKHCFYLCFEMRGGRNLRLVAGNWWCQLAKIHCKTLCVCVCLWKWQRRNFTSTTHLSCKTLYKTLLLFMFWMRGGRKLRAHGGQLVLPACQNTL